MKSYKLFLFFSVAFFTSNQAISQSLYTTASVQAANEKGTRSVSGKPGPNYWQNRGDYKMQIYFDPKTNVLSGEETITYFNNSPDALNQLIIRLYPDFYKKGTVRNQPVETKDENEGVTIEQLKIGNENIINLSQKGKAERSGTNLIVYPASVIAAKNSLNIFVKWHYTVNTGSQMRTGAVDSTSYFIAYFFPRVSVYDDINGWDDWSYRGVQEFYNDFGNFDVEINAPKNYVVWATGVRQNVKENFSETILKKLDQAAVSDKIVHVIDSNDNRSNTVLSPNTTGKWIFKANDVSDFAFALSNHYLWDASSVLADSSTKRKVLVSVAYNKIHKDYFEVAEMANQSVALMSHHYPAVPFPFPQITVFDGTDQMEYPMMVNDNPSPNRKYAVQLTSHEIFHSYFPFYMGINETQHAWMDEGWATIGESILSPIMGEPEDEGIYSRTRYEKISGTDKDMPLITNTKLYDDKAYYSNSYGKGGLCYWILQDMLGDKLFFKALHQYMNDWHGKHPLPSDFFNSFNAATDMDLNWFWRAWFYDLVYPDLAIKTVAENKITIGNKGGLPVPIQLSITLQNNKVITLHYGADVWKTGKQEFTVDQKFDSEIKSVKLGNEFIPDKFPENNFWGK